MPRHADLVLERLFDARSVRRGRALHRDGAVLKLVHDPDERILFAAVQGTRPYPYEVEVYLDDAGAPQEASCSCPVEIDCKHAVAALLAWRDAVAPSDDHMPRPGGTPTRTPRPGNPDSSSNDGTAARRFERWWERWQASLDDGAGEHDAAPAPRVGTLPRSRIYAIDTASGSTLDERPAVRITLLDAARTAAGTFRKGRRVDPDRGYGSLDTRLVRIDKEIEALGAAQLRVEQGRWATDDGRRTTDATRCTGVPATHCWTWWSGPGAASSTGTGIDRWSGRMHAC